MSLVFIRPYKLKIYDGILTDITCNYIESNAGVADLVIEVKSDASADQELI